MDAATDLEAADQLVAEAVGLLLEPLPLDETLTGAEMLELAGTIAEAANVRGTAGVRRLSGDLQRASAALGADSELMNDLRAASAAGGAPLSAAEARACLHLLRQHGVSGGRLRALRGVPDKALELRRVDAAYEISTLRQLVAARAETEERYLARVHPSALELNLDREIKALRDRGSLFGLIRTTSDAARDRVGPHLKGQAARSGSETMAEILEQVKAGRRELAKLDRAWAARPPWTRWLMPEACRPVRRDRARALDWVLEARDAGTFGTTELSLIRNDRARRFLASYAAQMVRERAPEPARPAFPDEAVTRLASGFSIPATTPPGAVLRWRQTMDKRAPLLARAVMAVRVSQHDPAVRCAVDAALERARSPFGPADPSRPELRCLLQEVTGAVTSAHVPLPEVAHPAITDVARELGQTERELAYAVSPRPPLRGPLRVAIAGRTKAGKTTLRKALTSDPDLTGVGRGAHRTTRRAEPFGWRGLEFIDTPGIAAYDDDYDAETALAACRDADAVLWVYAEMLRLEELEHLRVLLALGKPLLVVFNAKWRVDTAKRLDLFTRMPHLAFRHLDGHAERVAQVAALAGTAPPEVLPAHLGAAFEALRTADEALRDCALRSSRLPQVEEALHELLVLQAQPLRAAALAEAVRTPLILAAELVAGALDTVPLQVRAAHEQVAAERRDLARCADAAERAALGVLERQIAGMRADADHFVRRAARAADVQPLWQRFVEDQHFDDAIATFVDRLNRDTTRAGVLLEREDNLRRRIASTMSLDEAPQRSIWRSVRSAVIGAVRRIVTGLLGGGRRLTRRGAAGAAARKVPWLGWAMLAADALGGAARGITDEAARSRIEESRWHQDAHDAVRVEIDRLHAALKPRVVDAAVSARLSVETHLDIAVAAAEAADQQIHSYHRLLPQLQSAIRAVDLVLARRFASLCSLEPEGITAAARVPGSTFDIWVRAGADPDHEDLVHTIGTCLRERAVVHCDTSTLTLAGAAE